VDAELFAYRANPTNARFGRLYDAARPWLTAVGTATVGSYRSLSVSGALDDVVNEGALTLSTAARGFAYFCPACDRAFLHRRDLRAHAVAEHRRRGTFGAVSLPRFARTSARLAIRRVARNLHRPELLEAAEPDPVDPGDRVFLGILIDELRGRLNEDARWCLERLLTLEEFDPVIVGVVREETRKLISDKRTRRRRISAMAAKFSEPKWKELNVRTLRETAAEVLGIETEERTMKAAYRDLWEKAVAAGMNGFECDTCDAPVDDSVARCWACGSVLDEEAPEEEVVEVELLNRARKLGIETEGKDRVELLLEIERLETATRAARRNVDLLTIESKRLNEQVTEAMPDGWTKKRTKLYVVYLDPGKKTRIVIFHNGLKIHFRVEEGFLDGFPDLMFFDADERRRRHYGRVNYEYTGDTASYALDLCKRVLGRYK
jgi:hypothetical protein